MSLTRIITVCVGAGLSSSFGYGQEPASIPVPAPALSPIEGVPPAKRSTTTPYSVNPPPATWAPSETYEGAVYEDDAYGEDVISPIWARWFSKRSGNKKAPFQKYNHNPGDLQPRPVMSPLCSPTWGYHETCWREFPPVAPCVARCPVYTTSATNSRSKDVDPEPVAPVRTKQTVYRANNSAP